MTASAVCSVTPNWPMRWRRRVGGRLCCGRRAGPAGEGLDCILGNGPEGGTPNLCFSIPAELDMLTRILRADNPLRAEAHHLIGHDHQLLDLFERLAIPYDIVIHD
jgi:hypothetical protein